MTAPAPVELAVPAGERQLPALFLRPADARFLLVLGHGAGAGMRHSFLQALCDALAAEGLATLRYEFAYQAEGRGRPDPPARLEHTVRCAVRRAAELAPDLPLLAGGKSMGGRMTSQAAAREPLPGVHGIVFFGFPLHRPKAPADQRAAHLFGVDLPMLFLSGTRDPLCDLGLLRPVLERLGPRATLHVIEGADHSFGVLRRSGRGPGDVLVELAQTVSTWSATVR